MGIPELELRIIKILAFYVEPYGRTRFNPIDEKLTTLFLLPLPLIENRIRSSTNKKTKRTETSPKITYQIFSLL
jgi:hypothetical protein